MQAIHTKYLSPSNVKGARIKAECYSGSVIIGYPYELSGMDIHAKAVQALCDKLGWKNDYIGGQLKNGNYAFVSKGE